MLLEITFFIAKLLFCEGTSVGLINMFAVECLQASTAPLRLFPGLFPQPALLLVKEWSLELYEWAADPTQLELIKLYEEITFTKAISADKARLGDCDAVVLANSATLRVCKYEPQRGFQLVALWQWQEKLHIGHSLKTLERENGTFIASGALFDTFWLGKLVSNEITEIAQLDLGGCSLDWAFCGDQILLMRHSPGSDYPDLVQIALSGEFTCLCSLLHLVGSPDVLPVNLAALSPDTFAVFLDDGDFLSVQSSDGSLLKHFSLNKLYADSTPCADGIYMVSDDGSIFHITCTGQISLFCVSQPNSLIAYTSEILFTWSLTGNGKAFLLSRTRAVAVTSEIQGCGPILDAYEGDSGALIAACGYGDRATIRNAEKCKGYTGLDVVERVRMPAIGSAVSGIWVAADHLFLSYLTETKCLNLQSYSEVSVADFNFAAASSLHIAPHNAVFHQVTSLEVRSTALTFAFPHPATAARIHLGKVYACLTSLQLYRAELTQESSSVVLDVEAEVTALCVAEDRVFAGLATNKVLVVRESLQGGRLLEIDLNPVSGASIPNDIL